MPRARGEALRTVAATIADGDLTIDPGADRDRLRSQLVALPGIGPWTAEYVLMRAVGDPDAFMPTDLGVRHAFTAQGLDARPRAVLAHAERWRPWRAYASTHLWASLTEGA
jgi:AraC family transcriptional regulator of adaptative response / DNA-3-methyladenine glycosylase II